MGDQSALTACHAAVTLLRGHSPLERVVIGPRSLLPCALIPCLVAGVAAGPAAASSDRRAVPFIHDYCNSFGVFEYCEKAQGVYQSSQTPSGNLNLVVQQRRTYSFSENGVTLSSGQDSGSFKLLLRAGESQVVHSSSSSSSEFYGLVCTSTYRFHEAGGRVVYDASAAPDCSTNAT